MSDRISKDASEAWRDHVLKQVVDYLESNRDGIIDGFEAENAHNLSVKTSNNPIFSISMFQ